MSTQSTRSNRTILVSTSINSPSAPVWDVLADYNAMYTWAPNIQDTRSLSKIDRGVGAIRQNTAKGFGPVEQVVTDWMEGTGFTYSVEPFGPFGQTQTTYSVRSTGDETCECTIQIAYELSDKTSAEGPGELQLRDKLEAGLTQILGALKLRVETGRLVRRFRTE